MNQFHQETMLEVAFWLEEVFISFWWGTGCGIVGSECEWMTFGAAEAGGKKERSYSDARNELSKTTELRILR